MRRLLPILLLTAACSVSPDPVTDGGDNPDGGGDAGDDTPIVLPENPTLDQLSAYWDSKVCRVYACANRLRETPQVCTKSRTVKEFPYDLFRKAQASVASGRSTFRESRGKTCAFFLRQYDFDAPCFGANAPAVRDLREQMTALCGDLLEGTLGHGEACDADNECVPGAGCAFDRKPDCEGECVVWLKAGESCEGRWQDCAPNTYCNGTKCVARQLNRDGSACYDDGASCESGKCFNYRCTTTSAEKGECVEQADCVAGLFCRPLPASTGWQGVCQQPVQPGEACGYTIYCAGNQPCAGYFRKYGGGWTSGTCTVRPRDVGDTCIPVDEEYDYGDTGCYGDLVCDPETRRCREAPAVGEACVMPGGHCGLDAWCDEGTCRAKKGAGEEASGAEECLVNYDRYQGKCVEAFDWERCGMR